VEISQGAGHEKKIDIADDGDIFSVSLVFRARTGHG
jgi:hypothetical protein